jgi:hypothetical protein
VNYAAKGPHLADLRISIRQPVHHFRKSAPANPLRGLATRAGPERDPRPFWNASRLMSADLPWRVRWLSGYDMEVERRLVNSVFQNCASSLSRLLGMTKRPLESSQNVCAHKPAINQ